MKLEYYWYETSPFVYTATGGALLGRSDSMIAILSSVLLLTAGGTILFLRRRHALETRESLERERKASRARPMLKAQSR